MSLIKTKVRAVGTSLGVLIPSEAVRENKLKEGQEIEISIFKRDPNRLKLIREAFGSAKGAKFKFERDRSDRIERWERERKNSSR